MKTEMLSTRIDHDTKAAFTHVCDQVGLSPSQAIKLFAKAVINYGGIPFELRSKQPNAQTLFITLPYKHMHMPRQLLLLRAIFDGFIINTRG